MRCWLIRCHSARELPHTRNRVHILLDIPPPPHVTVRAISRECFACSSYWLLMKAQVISSSPSAHAAPSRASFPRLSLLSPSTATLRPDETRSPPPAPCKCEAAYTPGEMCTFSFARSLSRRMPAHEPALHQPSRNSTPECTSWPDSLGRSPVNTTCIWCEKRVWAAWRTKGLPRTGLGSACAQEDLERGEHSELVL